MAIKDKTILNPLDSHPQQVLLTNKLQIADILEHALKWVGKADIWQTTFSVSEEFLRRLYHLNKRNDFIRSANVIIDFKATQKTVKLWQFISNVFDDVFLADNHSKILLAKSISSDRTVAIISSQNLTRGNRFESTIITTDRAVFDSLLNDWETMAEKHSITLNELLDRTTEDD